MAICECNVRLNLNYPYNTYLIVLNTYCGRNDRNDTRNISHIETVVTDIQFTNKTVSVE